MIKGTLTGKFVSAKEKTFKGQDGKEISFNQLILLNENTNSGVSQFTISQDSDISALKDIKAGQEITVAFEYQEQLKKVGDQWINKPRLYVRIK